MKKSKIKSGQTDRHPRMSMEELKNLLKEASTYSAEELLKEVSEHPNGQLSAMCCINFCWEEFCKQYGITPPERKEFVSEEAFKTDMRKYENFVDVSKSMALFWYLMGLHHHREIYQQFMPVQEETPSEGVKEKD